GVFITIVFVLSDKLTAENLIKRIIIQIKGRYDLSKEVGYLGLLFTAKNKVAQSEFQFAIPCYWLILESKEEVTEKQVQETLKILYRNIDILRLCIRKEKDDFWFYEMDEERILLRISHYMKSSTKRRTQISILQQDHSGVLYIFPTMKL
ncbi:hypothetical protein Avbf_18909, partial [Armadillidium vulgare]